MIAQDRQSDYPPLSERFAKVPSAPENPTPLGCASAGELPQPVAQSTKLCHLDSQLRCCGHDGRQPAFEVDHDRAQFLLLRAL